MTYLAEAEANTIVGLVGQIRERVNAELGAQAEQFQKLEQALQELRARQRHLEEFIQQQFEALSKGQISGAPSGSAPLEKVLAAVRNLITATLPGQVEEVLTEEAEQLGVRSAVFEVRGKAAWGASARGFGPQLSEKAFRSVVVPLNQDSPFRQVYETGGHADANAEQLKKNRNVLEKLKPDPKEPILLLPIRSAGSVSAIFYADPARKGASLPVDALKILAEFAGAQLDRLMALSGSVPMPAVEAEAVEAEPVAVPSGGEAGDEAEAGPASAATGAGAPQPVSLTAPPAGAVGIDVSKLNEADRKVHQDAKRFAKLLVSEIDLYNKPKVADGRKNRNLYQVLKTDIERSRQTYEKRFGKTVAKQVDYFHEELVRTLASNDPALLGADYPGPSV